MKIDSMLFQNSLRSASLFTAKREPCPKSTLEYIELMSTNTYLSIIACSPYCIFERKIYGKTEYYPRIFIDTNYAKFIYSVLPKFVTLDFAFTPSGFRCGDRHFPKADTFNLVKSDPYEAMKVFNAKLVQDLEGFTYHSALMYKFINMAFLYKGRCLPIAVHFSKFADNTYGFKLFGKNDIFGQSVYFAPLSLEVPELDDPDGRYYESLWASVEEYPRCRYNVCRDETFFQ